MTRAGAGQSIRVCGNDKPAPVIRAGLQFPVTFNSTRQTGADGADLVDGAALRGLGSDQTLVLVNRQRQHQHTVSLVNIFGGSQRLCGTTGQPVQCRASRPRAAPSIQRLAGRNRAAAVRWLMTPYARALTPHPSHPVRPRRGAIVKGGGRHVRRALE